jgi:hypothetical protein
MKLSEMDLSRLAEAPWPIYNRIQAAFATRSGPGDEAYEAEVDRLDRLAESGSFDGVADDGTRARFEAAGIPVVPRVRRPAARSRETLESARGRQRLREAGIPVVEAAAEDRLEDADVRAELAGGITRAIDATSPIPLTVPVGEDGMPTLSGLREAADLAERFRADADARTAEFEGVPMTSDGTAQAVEAGRKMRAAQAAARRQRGGRGSSR